MGVMSRPLSSALTKALSASMGVSDDGTDSNLYLITSSDHLLRDGGGDRLMIKGS